MSRRYSNTLELIEHAFSTYPDRPAYSCAGQELSFKEIDELSARFASFCHHDLGLEPGDRIALQMPNILQFPVALYGALRAGLVVVNTNPLYTAREVRHQLKDSGAKALVVLSNVAKSASEIIAETDVKHVIVTNFADLHSSPKRLLINFVIKHVKKMVPDFSFGHSINFRQSVAKPAKPLKAFSVDGDSLMVLQYTGGTTGVSKGAMLTHHNLASNVWQMVEHMPEAFSPGEETFITCLPLYHIYALNLHALAGFSNGEHNVLIPNPRDLKATVDALKKVKMTVFIGINTLYVALCRYAAIKDVDFSALKVSSAGGMALTEDAAKLWHELTGCEVCEGYGLTETSPVVSGNKIGDIRIGYIGVPMRDTEIRILSDEGQALARGEVGELCVKGPQVMAGYWNRPEETRNVLSEDGWLRTGDMAIYGEDGYLKIVDRKKDMILVSGFNVYPNEIEDVVTQHEKVVEAAAVGVEDEKSGEAVKLFIVAADDSLTEDDVKAYCKQHLTGYKRPRHVEFRDSLPKSNVGKILRRELRDSEAQANSA